jgi:hypothetical protein
MFRRLARAFALTFMLAIAAATPASAAAPRYLIVTGPGVRSPVLLGNWMENLRLMLAAANAPVLAANQRAELPGRVRLRLALFWGWPARPKPRWPSQANQFGWFYPASAGAPPAIVMVVGGVRTPRLATWKWLTIFARHHVPVALGSG